MMATDNDFKLNRSKLVTLLDRRCIEVDFFGNNWISSDMADHLFDFRWAQIGGVSCVSALTILRGLLTTHSLPYVVTCNRYIGNAFSDAYLINKKPIERLGVAEFSDWPKRYGLKTWPFVRAILSKWIEAGLPGLGPDLIAFLNGPEAFEERDDGWYFALVANDPERGAFTEQELRSIRDGVNRAFEEGAVDLFEWALVWFLIATGLRPVQIARMRFGDVIVTTGPEGREITLCVPLAKGEGQIGGAR